MTIGTNREKKERHKQKRNDLRKSQRLASATGTQATGSRTNKAVIPTTTNTTGRPGRGGRVIVGDNNKCCGEDRQRDNVDEAGCDNSRAPAASLRGTKLEWSTVNSSLKGTDTQVVTLS